MSTALRSEVRRADRTPDPLNAVHASDSLLIAAGMPSVAAGVLAQRKLGAVSVATPRLSDS